MYAIWLERVNRNSPVKFAPTSGSRICSEHFSMDMFEKGGQRMNLKPYAVPTIFPKYEVCIFDEYSFISVRGLVQTLL